MQKSLARYFREDLRSSRAAAHLDAESFDSVLFAIEQLGHHLSRGEATGLGEYRRHLIKLAGELEVLYSEWPRRGAFQ